MKFLLFCILLPIAAPAQNDTAMLDAYMKAQASIYNFNGNVLVADKGRVIYKRSFGYADFNSQKLLDENSIFDCGSVAKEFTAMAILMLKDKGKISLTDTLTKFFPGLPYHTVTIQHLLTHTSGMPDGFALIEKYFDHNKIATNTDLLRLLEKEHPLLYFKPGTNLMYSGTAFNLLALIIEKITGQSYRDYMNKNIFKPLGMAHTQVANFLRTAKNIPGFAEGYIYSDSLKKYVVNYSKPSGWTSYFTGITGEGMIVTTSGDLLKWDRALQAHQLLNPVTQQQMLTLQAEKIFPKVAFGYGMRVGKNENGNFIFHNGYYPGYKSMHLCYTDNDITVIVLSNNESQSEFIADALAAITLHKQVIMPYVHTAMERPDIPNNFTGKYMMQLTRPPYMAVFPVEFIKRDGTIFLHPSGGTDIELKQGTANTFFFGNNTDQQLEFETTADGQLIHVWHIAWGLKKELKKVE